MKIFIDGEQFETSAEAADNKIKLLDEVESHLNGLGRVYTTIIVDGTELERKAFTRLRGGMEARFATCQIHSLVVESLHEGLSYIKRLSEAVNGMAGEFERRETQKAQANLAAFAEGMSWLFNVMQKSQQLLGIPDVELGDKNTTVFELNKSLTEISNCVVDGRDTEIAFHLRQKIMPEISKFAGYFEKLLAQAGKE